MPKYTPASDELDASYQGAEGGAEVTPPGETPSQETETVDEENANTAEILVAKNQLPSGTKEGDTCTFRVKKDFGDEFSLEYVKSGEESSEPEEPMAQERQELTALSGEGE